MLDTELFPLGLPVGSFEFFRTAGSARQRASLSLIAASSWGWRSHRPAMLDRAIHSLRGVADLIRHTQKSVVA